MSKRTKFLLGIGVIAALVVGWQIAAFAVVEQSGFQDDDGNLVIDPAPALGTFDWNGFAPTTWTGTAPNRTAEDSADGWDFDGIEDAQATNTDSAFAGGTKQDDDCATVTGAKAPNKDDMRRVYFSTKSVNGDVFLNLAWVRIPQNTTSPSAHIAFEFNQSDTLCGGSSGKLVERTPGDLLVVYDFEGGATQTPVITLRKWVASGSCEVGSSTAPCWGPATNLTALGFAEAKVNTFGSVVDQIGPTAPQTLGTSEFGEAGINLSDALNLGDNACIAFGNAFAVSRSSGNSGTAQMKDLVGPKNVDIKNCGSVIIRKVTDPSPDATDTTFNYTTTGVLDPATFALKDGESQDYGSEIQAGSYSATEADPTADGFTLTDIDCSASDLSHGSSVTEDEATRTASFDLAAQDTIDCTFTNTLNQGALAIVKNSTKGGLVSNAGAVFSFDGQSVKDNDTSGANGLVPDEDPDVGEVCVSGLDLGDYTVNETSPPPGYGSGATDPAQTVTVVNNTDCTAANYPTGAAVATFTNPPLGEIEVQYRDLGSGETAASIVCDNGTNTVDPVSENGAADPAFDDTDETITDLPPGTYNCEVVVDP